ncbi:MAG: Hsp20/alpha crystallin family protein [Candidatus Liptonbacteria bacterium]|nr:Hsp20/alpha crystallin family protein [Candidatus Liptonbacteria bacterium]
MNDNEEKFLDGSENEPEVELVKAMSVASRPKASPRRVEEDFDSEPEGQLTIDVYQTPTEIVIESAIAGVTSEDLDVDVTTDSVSIIGRRRREKQVKDEDYFYQECYWGKFSRSVILPQEVDPEESKVTLKNGILTIHLPKLNRKRSKKLRVKAE